MNRVKNMRINHYEFPEGTPTEIMLKEGCAVILKTGEEIYVDCIPLDTIFGRLYLSYFICIKETK